MPSTKQITKASKSPTRTSKATSKPSSRSKPAVIARKRADPKLESPFEAKSFDSIKVAEPVCSVDDDAPRNAVTYEDRYVAFIDILGFRDVIRRSSAKSSGDIAGKIYAALDIDGDALQDGIRAEFDGDESPDLRVHSFSDCVVISSNATELGLIAMLFACWRLASNWLNQEFLCRGGVTRGQVTHKIGSQSNGNATLVFGPAFVEAYVLETEVADVSRIVLSKAVREDWTSYKDNSRMKKFAKLVCRSDDGPMYVDVFAHLRKHGFSLLGHDHTIEAKKFYESLKTHYEDSSDHPRLFRKVKWLVDQFNKAIQSTNFAGFTISD